MALVRRSITRIKAAGTVLFDALDRSALAAGRFLGSAECRFSVPAMTSPGPRRRATLGLPGVHCRLREP
jgi:hypothetical protein